MQEIISLADYQAKPNSLAGKTIAITGATDGIGQQLAYRCAKLGARLILLGRNTAKLKAVVDDILTDKGLQPMAVTLDLEKTTWDGYMELAEDLDERFESIDGLVHVAGIIGDRTPIEHHSPLTWARVIHINLSAAFLLTKALLPFLKSADNASLVFSSSSVGRVGKPFWGAYSVSKFGTEGLSQVMAQEYDADKLRINCINPGATATKMRLQAYPAEDRSRLKTAAWVAEKYIYLLEDDSKGISGKSFNAQ